MVLPARHTSAPVACRHAEHSELYSGLEVYARYGPPDMTLQLEHGISLAVHSIVVKGLSNVFRSLLPSDAHDVPLDGDDTMSWVQALAAMYLTMDGASNDDKISVILVSYTHMWVHPHVHKPCCYLCTVCVKIPEYIYCM